MSSGTAVEQREHATRTATEDWSTWLAATLQRECDCPDLCPIDHENA
jgi:hypothetical protein